MYSSITVASLLSFCLQAFLYKVYISIRKQWICKKKVRNCKPHMTFLASFIIMGVLVSSILTGCVRPAPANRRRCWPGRGGVGNTRETTLTSAPLQWQGEGGEDHGFSYLLESHMTYLAGSHVLRSWPGIRLKWKLSCTPKKWCLVSYIG
jgi:hypothetical protein